MLALGGGLSPIAISGDCILAEITPDATLGAESSVITPTNIDGLPTEQIDGGATRGANLFHSFEQFSVPTQGAAFFNNALDIQNIISRVTGSSVSNIDGLIRANGTANLFLLNPNGIIFGPNASLNIGGSFLGSTASGLNFADGTQFSATAPQTTPLLTVNVPIGLQYEGNAGSILNQSRATNSRGQRVGLQVLPDTTLALLGGDVSLDGGILFAPGGRVELGGLAGAGTVGLNVDGSNLRLSFLGGVARADVSLTNGANLNVRAGGGGSIALNARNLNMAGGSELQAGIASGLGSIGSQGGEIEINATGAINLFDGSFISNSTFGQGNAGSVNILARDTVSFDGDSNAFSDVNEEAVGNGGNINITTRSLSMTNGSQLQASTFGEGNAGSVNILARDTVSFDGASSYESYRFPSAAFTSVESGAVGKGGNIDITAGSLSLTNGAQLVAVTEGRGDAGSVNINARDTVSFDGVNSNGLPSAAFSNVAAEAVGNGGSINITAGSFWVTNGAGLSASTEGSGAAGNIEVAARSIHLENQAALSSDTTAGQGNIILRSEDLVLRRGSNITTNATGTAIGGNITIDTDVLAALENSDIRANAEESFGGRIIINAQGIFGTEFRNQQTPLSDITASSNLGPQFSGTVEINTPDVDSSLGLVTLPAELVEASGLIATGCVAGEENKFIVTGRGGLPPNPGAPLNGEAVLTNWATLDPEVESRSGAAPSTNLTRERAPTQIVEAQGWVINNLGEVVLTALAPNVTPTIPWMTPPTCHTP